MTTQVEVNRLVKPLLARNPDLIQVKNLLYIKPIRHIQRAIGIGRTSNKAYFTVSWMVRPLCVPSEYFRGGYGESIYSPVRGTLWNIPEHGTGIVLAERVEEIGLPIIRGVETIDDFCNLDQPYTIFFHPWRRDDRLKPYVDAARGDFDDAVELCRKLESEEPYWRNDNLADDYEIITKILYPLVAKRDLKGLAMQMREWEAFTARNLGIEKYWEPTPFPFEERG